jgi:hypothetical protein
MKTENTQITEVKYVSEAVDQLLESHELYRNKLLPEIDLLFLTAMRLNQSIDLRYLYKMYESFHSHFLHHIQEEEEELYPLTKLAYERLDTHGEKIIIDEHNDIPENLLVAIIKCIGTIKDQKRELSLATLKNKLEAFSEELKHHSFLEEAFFQLRIK